MSGALGDAAKLRAAVLAFPGQGFAVLDGARFADLPKLCRRERLLARSLHLMGATRCTASMLVGRLAQTDESPVWV